MIKCIKEFKIAENSKKFDIVELLHDELKNVFIVRWKWQNMIEPEEKKYNLYNEAKEKYDERKQFAISVN